MDLHHPLVGLQHEPAGRLHADIRSFASRARDDATAVHVGGVADDPASPGRRYNDPADGVLRLRTWIQV